MITIFTTAKRFEGGADLRQRLAIRSWQDLGDGIDVILIGKEGDNEAVAKRLGIRYEPRVNRNSFGMPLLNDLFAIGQRMAIHGVVCYANADIIILDGFLETIKRITQQFGGQFLAMGQRLDVPEDTAMLMSRDWKIALRKLAKSNGRHYIQCASDFFIFRKGLWDLPDLVVGCPGWDNWMLWRAVQEQVPVVDMTPVITVVHPEHGYGAGESLPRKPFWKSPKYQHNKKLIRDGQILEFGLSNVRLAGLLWQVAADSIYQVI